MLNRFDDEDYLRGSGGRAMVGSSLREGCVFTRRVFSRLHLFGFVVEMKMDLLSTSKRQCQRRIS